MKNKTGFVGIAVMDSLRLTLHTYRKWLQMGGAAAAGFIMSFSAIFGGAAPFGVSLCAALPMPFGIPAAAGAILGYALNSSVTNLKYIAAVLLVLATKWILSPRLPKKLQNGVAFLCCFVALSVSSAAVLLSTQYSFYELALALSEVFLACGATYFFARALKALQLGGQTAGRSDVSCVVVSLAVVLMGFSSITIYGASLGRTLTLLAILICARYGGEAAGSVAGITGGIAMGLAGGDYSYAITAYSFGGLVAGIFGSMGRIAAAGSLIAVNAVTAFFIKDGVGLGGSLAEMFIASLIFVALPQSWLAKLGVAHIIGAAAPDSFAQNTLRDKLYDISAALTDIGETTRKVSEGLAKMDCMSPDDVGAKAAEQVCKDCGLKTTCWQFDYSRTTDAVNNAMLVLRRDGIIAKDKIPRYLSDTCCRLDDFIGALNANFREYVSREGVALKVSKVRGVVTDQFDGMSMMLSEISNDLCERRLMDQKKIDRVTEYFLREGITPSQVACFVDRMEHVSVELTFPAAQEEKLMRTKSTLDLCLVLEAELDMPHVVTRAGQVNVVYTEKAAFTADIGAYQIASGTNKMCGDAYEYIKNRRGRCHLILSDGMGSGKAAAVDSNMATGLLTKLISVGVSHSAALKIVNSALLIKSGDESLATIDIASVDLFTGRVELFKAGAAPTFILRGGQAGYVNSTSLPAGILRGVSFEESSVTLGDGDVVVLVSDGVISTGSDWVKSELQTLGSKDVQRLCEKLAMTAKIRRCDGHDDDITVVAARITAEK